MIESIDNVFQLIITGLCTVIAVYNGLRDGHKLWAVLGLFSGVFFMGDLYWQLYLVFYDHTPAYSDIPYASWGASYVFLLLLLAEFQGGAVRQYIKRFWPVFIFTAGMCAYYMYYGEYLRNIVCAVLMGLLICRSLGGLANTGKSEELSGSRMVYLFVLVFCILEYGLWTASCIWSGDTISNPYFWFDFMLSIDILLITFAVRKAVAYGLY